MMRIRFYIFCFTLFFVHLSAQDYVLEKHGIEKGLNTLHILTIFQASNKFIWLGTDRGVSHFDGYIFKNYTLADKNRIGSVYAIAEDKSGIIWIGSDEGLFYFDGQGINPTAWKYEKENEHSIKDLLFDDNGDLWIASGRGPFLIKKEQLQSTIRKENKLHHSPTLQVWDSSDLCDRRAHTLAFDKDNNLWIGNYFTVVKAEGDSLKKYYDTEQIKRCRVSAIIPYKDSVAISIRYKDVEGDNFNHIHPTCEVFEKTVTLKKYKNKLIGLDGSSIFYVQDSERVPLFIFPPDKITAPKDFMIDHEGHIWIVSESGLAKFTKNIFTDFSHISSIQNKQMYSILSLDKELIIGNLNAEILRFTNDTNFNANKVHQLEGRSFISAMTSDSEKNIWLSLNVEGLAKIDSNHNVSYYSTEEGIADDGMSFIIRDKINNLWAGGDGGVTHIDASAHKTPTFTNYRYESGNDNYIVFKKGIVDQFNRPWFATTEGLFTLSNKELIPVYQSQEKGINYIYDLIHTQNKKIILATGQKGLIECNINESGMITNVDYLFSDPYYRKKNFISLIEDSDQSIWAVCYNEICKIFFDQKYGQLVTCYNHKDGFPLYDYSKASIHEDNNNKIWVISPNGICNFDPKTVTLNSREAILYLHNVSIENIDENSDFFNKPIREFSNHSFSHTENYLSFDFSSLSFSNASNTRYKYFLEGVDNRWRESTGRNIIRYPQLTSGSYTFKAKAANNHGIWNKKPLEYSFTIKPPFWKTIWFCTVCFFTIIGFVYIYIQQKINRIKSEEAEQHKINNLIAELKIKAIRSQMNPHFIFNCLNSIQSCISQQETQIASIYLTKFARLLRMVLDYCEQNKISLDKEIEFLNLYLSLEKLRFGSELEYAIEIDQNIDTEEIMVPSFLMQPFVENSIWHGLLHKDGNRKLWIRFKLTNNENIIQCEIEDNGIGREKSQSIKKDKQFSISHQSKGMSLSAERIHLIKMQSDEDIYVDIEDLHNQQNSPIGTKVKLLLPTY